MNGKRVSTPTYKTWIDMRRRCTVPSRINFKDYGGRGIAYDPRWHRFEAFLADMGERPAGCTLDRIDNDGPYCKDNCRWATVRQQENNKRTNRVLTVDGVSLTVTQWAERTGINAVALFDRLWKGWPAERAVKTPLRAYRH